ncbi:hypothetical protein OPT61_g8125 [Boeremia exigua]|uniref:Uncharacterized protein n=1 Tax=Boeremia exigua TaxID=749465 RepID=A0ACC2HZY2_9PLEO|nr:hypothetical protein OPT61_g8125 [Boeremia exigua]
MSAGGHFVLWCRPAKVGKRPAAWSENRLKTSTSSLATTRAAILKVEAAEMDNPATDLYSANFGSVPYLICNETPIDVYSELQHSSTALRLLDLRVVQRGIRGGTYLLLMIVQYVSKTPI